MTWIRSDGPYSLTDCGVPFHGSVLNIGQTYFDDGTNVYGLFGINTAIDESVFLLINITDLINDTETYFIHKPTDPYATGGGPGVGGTIYYNGYVYFSGPTRYLYRWNVSTGVCSSINDLYPGYVSSASIGSDGNLYFGIIGWNAATSYVLQYNPSTQAFANLGSYAYSTETPSQLRGICCDGSYVYVGVQRYSPAEFYITIIDLADNSKTYWGIGSGYSSITIDRTTDASHPWQAQVDGSYYECSGGTLTSQSPKTSSAYYQNFHTPYYMVSQDEPNTFDGDLVAWDVQIDRLTLSPWDGSPDSTFRARSPVGSGTWKELTLDWTSYPEVAASNISPFRVLPISEQSNTAIIFGDNYTPRATFNYITKAIVDYLDYDSTTAYVPIRTPTGGYYWAGYPNSLLKYDPASLWTLTALNWARQSSPGSTNPYPTLASGGKSARYGNYDKNGVIWVAHRPRYDTDGWLVWFDPSNDSTDKYGDVVKGVRSLGMAAISNARDTVCVGDNLGNLFIFDADTKGLLRTIDLSSYGNNIFCVDIVTGANMLVIATGDDGSSGKVLSINVTDGTVNWSDDLTSGLPFGDYYTGAGEYKCENMRLPMGLDGEYYVFIGTHLYSFDDGGNFTDLGDLGIYSMITFDAQGNALLYAYDSSLRTITGFFEQTGIPGRIDGIEGGQPGGMPGGRVDGI